MGSMPRLEGVRRGRGRHLAWSQLSPPLPDSPPAGPVPHASKMLQTLTPSPDTGSATICLYLDTWSCLSLGGPPCFYLCSSYSLLSRKQRHDLLTMQIRSSYLHAQSPPMTSLDLGIKSEPLAQTSNICGSHFPTFR